MLSRLAVAFSVVGSGALAAPPALPEIESVLTKATDKMQDFAAQASAMQARVAEKQKASRAALAAQKAKYEGKLAEQVQDNKNVAFANDGIRAEIKSLEDGNTALKQASEKLRQDNKLMHDTLSGINAKVDAADKFLADSLRLTDDTAAPELNVLQPAKPEPTLEHFLDVARTDIAEGAKPSVSLAQMRMNDLFSQSLLQISAKQTPKKDGEDPEDFVEILSHSLTDIASAEKEGVAQLEANFRLIFEQGAKEHESLLAVQKELNETRTSLTSRQTELTAAKNHLKTTGEQLRQRLHGLRIFARKVDDAAGDALKSMKTNAPSASAQKAAVAPAAPAAAVEPKNATVAGPSAMSRRKRKAAQAAKSSLLEMPAAAGAKGAMLRQQSTKESFLSQFAHSLR